jgi:hypothetical protein
MLRELVEELREDVGVHPMTDTWPSAGTERRVLAEISEKARVLAGALRQLSPRTSQVVAKRLWESLGELDPAPSFDAARRLDVLAFVADEGAHSLPEQSRRRARMGIVARVHKVVRPIGVKVSAADGSVFHALCTDAFILAGVVDNDSTKLPNPAGAIRAYIERIQVATGQ